MSTAPVTGDGKWVVTGSSDETWRRWDVDAYNEVRVLHDAGSNAVLSARFLPGGHQVVTALADGTVRHWDAETGLEIGKFHEGHDFLTTKGIFFRDGKRVATAAGDETVRVWDIKSGIQSLCLKGTGRRGVVALSNEQYHFYFRFHQTNRSRPLPEEVRVTIFQIVRELFMNIAKHARVTQVVVRLEFLPTQVMVEVSDNGRGFDPKAILYSKRPHTGWGLLGIQERALPVGRSV